MFHLSFIAMNVLLLYCFKAHETLLVIIRLNLFLVGLTDVGKIKCYRSVSLKLNLQSLL